MANTTTTVTFGMSPSVKKMLRSATGKERRSVANMIEVMVIEYAKSLGIVENKTAPKREAASNSKQASVYLRGDEEDRTMNVFEFRNRLIDDYSRYVRGFINAQDEHLARRVHQGLNSGVFWPEPLIQLNPSFEPGGRIEDLVGARVLHETCARTFRKDKDTPAYPGGRSLCLHKHQEEAVRHAKTGANYVLTTGTGSGKILADIVPIVDHGLRRGPGRGVQAIVICPMYALANSPEDELRKETCVLGNREDDVENHK